MEYEWVIIPEFPNYMISNHGDVVNRQRGSWLRSSRNQDGIVKIGLAYNGRQYTRSVAVLVAENFVPGKNEIFDTPIHLDGDKTNNRVDNIVWRPRWFAKAYTEQFSKVNENDHLGPLRDIATDQRYYDIYQAAILHGLLFTDIRRSITMKDTTFPTFQRFEWVRQR